MIAFRANGFELDLTLFGLSLNEESNFFIDNLLKSYSFPFELSLLDEFVQHIGFPNLENNDDPSTSISGQLIVDLAWFPATLRFGEQRGESIEAILYYGEEELPVYGTKMSQLPWPIHLVTSLQNLADSHLDKAWPEVSHNFPMIFRPSIGEKADYENFQNFVNLTNGSNSFVSNNITGTDPDLVFNNYNVLSPCPYLLELLRVGFAAAGKKLKGDVLENEALKRLFYIPEAFIEKYRGSTYLEWQFGIPDRTDTISNTFVGVYERSFTPAASGTYKIEINLNLDPVLASYFRLRVFRKDESTSEETIYYYAESRANRVTIEKDLEVNISGINEFDPVWIELILPYRSGSIKAFNSFQMAYKEGRLNDMVGSSYTLSDFVPDMTFGEFVNAIKNWLNLDVRIDDENAYLDYLDTTLDALDTKDQSNLEEKYPRIQRNGRRLFKLIYADDQQVMVDATGQVYSDLDRLEEDIVTIKMETMIAKVESNFNFVTAVHPENGSLCFGIYDGITQFRNLAIDTFDGFSGRVEDVYNTFWKDWLYRRSTNVTIEDSFMVHATQEIDIRSKIYKYNRILLPKVIRKRRKNLDYWEVEMEAESI